MPFWWKWVLAEFYQDATQIKQNEFYFPILHLSIEQQMALGKNCNVLSTGNDQLACSIPNCHVLA